MTKKQATEQLDRHTAEAVASAVEFTATIRALDPRGSGLTKSFTLRRPTLDEARDVAGKLEVWPAAGGRKALVYAVAASGASCLIPSDYAAG